MPLKAKTLAWRHKVTVTVFSFLQVPPDMVAIAEVTGSPPHTPTSLPSGARILLLSSGIFLPGSPQCVFELQSHLSNRKTGYQNSIPAAWDQF